MDLNGLLNLWPPFGGAAGSRVGRARIREAVMAALKADAYLASVVGTKVFFQAAAGDGAGPYLVATLDSVAREHTLDGPTGVAVATFTFAATSRLMGQDVEAAEAVRLLFAGFTGPLGADPNLVTVEETFAPDELDRWDGPDDGSDDGTHSTPVTYSFRYREVPPR